MTTVKSGPLPRRKRLIVRSAWWSAAVLAGFTVVAAGWYQRQLEDPSMLIAPAGITDDLGRDLPADFPRLRFTDVARESGVDFVHFSGARQSLLPEDMGSGASWGDIDGDGDDDLFIANFSAPLRIAGTGLHPGGRGNALYRNDGGRFTDVSASSGVDRRGAFMGGYFGDYDGDGDLDLYVTAYGSNVLWRNDGNGVFADVTDRAGADDPRWSTGAAWGDYDGDGDLDLYVCNYVDFATGDGDRQAGSQYGYAVPSTLNPATYDPAPNALFRNDGDGTFTDVAVELGVDDPQGRSLGVGFVDLDDDGDLDLYVADDVSKNALFVNQGDSSFVDQSASSLSADYRGAMGMAFGDVDDDGDIDFFVTHWIAQENALYQSALRGVPATGKLQFFDIADQLGLGASGLDRVSWGTGFIDYDNDGRLDLFVVNGHTFESKEDRTRLVAQRPQLFWHRPDEGFFDTSGVSGAALQRAVVGRGAAFADYDDDGDIDALVTVNGGPAMLLRNDGGNALASIGIELQPPAAAVGARVRVRIGALERHFRASSQGSYLSQSSERLQVGTGDAQIVDAIEVQWPSGPVDRWQHLPTGQIHRLTIGGGHAARPYR